MRVRTHGRGAKEWAGGEPPPRPRTTEVTRDRGKCSAVVGGAGRGGASAGTGGATAPGQPLRAGGGHPGVSSGLRRHVRCDPHPGPRREAGRLSGSGLRRVGVSGGALGLLAVLLPGPSPAGQGLQARAGVLGAVAVFGPPGRGGLAGGDPGGAGAAAEVCWACSRAAWGRAPGGLSGAPRGARREAGGRVMAAPSTIGGEAFRRRVQLKVELASIERPPR
jgi:hypothetical protein